MNPIACKWSWGLQKTSHIYRSFLFRNAPQFVYSPNARPLEGEIPVFTFHEAVPASFERQCRYLATNGYKTLSADEFLHALTHPGQRVEKSILITFDDGLKTVWTVAYPILKKYGLRAVCFLIPGCIPDTEANLRPTLADVESGKARLQEVAEPGMGPEALMSWKEIKTLHESGVIDFQSHSLHHHLVPVSTKIFEFVHPQYNTHFYGNIHVPFYPDNGRDRTAREPLLGMPIYNAKPRMQAERRYFEDEAVRRLCVQFVSNQGGPAFFQRSGWRGVLRGLVSNYRAKAGERGRYETADERNREVTEDLRRSKQIIEMKLPGKEVRHLCYPWYEAADFAVEASRSVGFHANYFGNVWGRASNRPGDDPFRIARVEGHLLERLPGQGRISRNEVFRRLYLKKKAVMNVGQQ